MTDDSQTEQQDPGDDASTYHSEAFSREAPEETSESDSQAQYAGQDEHGNEVYFGDEYYPPNQDQFSGFVGIETFCRNCDDTFPSKSQLHKHLRKGCPARKEADSSESRDQSRNQDPSAQELLEGRARPSSKELLANLGEAESDSAAIGIPRIVESAASTAEQGTGFGFRSWNYAMAKIRLTKSGQDDDVCLDTGCGVTLIDRLWLRKLLPEAVIATMASPLRVRGVGSSQHETSEYLVTPCYFPGVDDQGNKVLDVLEEKYTSSMDCVPIC